MMHPRRQTELAERLERLALQRPAAYRSRVLALAALGYGFVYGVLALVLAALVGVVWLGVTTRGVAAVVRLAIPLGILACVIVRALWVRLEPPTGRVVTEAETPALHEMAERVRRQVDAPRADVVLLTPDLNASVAEVPRLGLLGWPRRYLSIGLPLAAALSPAQFEAVLAHEFAHLSRRHARFSHRIWRLSRVWAQLLDAMQRDGGWGAKVFERFFAWYAPHFEVYGAVLSRQAELEADQVAARATSERASAEALVTLEVAARFLDDAWWPAIYRATHNDPTPPRTAYTDLVRALRSVRTVEGADAWMKEALELPTRVGSSHPALRDRLAALGVATDSLGPVALTESHTAATALFGDAVAEMTAELDLEWRHGVAVAWREQHQHLRTARERRERLAERARAGALAPDDAWTLARETLELDGEAPALELLRDLVARVPQHAAASFTLGRLMLARGDEGGLSLLEVAAAADPQATLAACELADDFLSRRGRRDEALAWQERAHRHRQLLERAMREREGIARKDTIAPLQLGDADLALVRAALAGSPEVRCARVARKVTTLLPDRPFIVVAVERDAPWWKYRGSGESHRLLGELLARMNLSVECDLWIVLLEGETRWMRKKLDKAGASVVYTRE